MKSGEPPRGEFVKVPKRFIDLSVQITSWLEMQWPMPGTTEWIEELRKIVHPPQVKRGQKGRGHERA